MEKAASIATSVEEYLQALPDAVRITLEKVRQSIRAAAPKAEEGISYQIPAYKYKGSLVFFASFKNHCSFFVASKNLLKIFSEELASFKTAGTTIHFSPEHPLPSALIKKIVKARLKENEERVARRKTKSKSTA